MEDSTIAVEGVRKILFMTEDVRNVGSNCGRGRGFDNLIGDGSRLYGFPIVDLIKLKMI